MSVLAFHQKIDPTTETFFSKFSCLIATAFNVPITIISLLDENGSVYEAAYGLTTTQCELTAFFCQEVLAVNNSLIVTDLQFDPVFTKRPFLIDSCPLRFYAGVPLKSVEGANIGTLNLFDYQPKNFSPAQERDLQDYAAMLVEHIELQGQTRKLHDVSARLRQSEKQFQSFFHSSVIGRALVGLDGRYLEVNQTLCRILGYSKEEFLAMKWTDITYPDDIDVDQKQINCLLAHEIHSYEVEKRCIHKDGHIVWLRINRSLVTDQHNTPIYFNTQCEDISERKRSEDEIRFQAHLLNSVEQAVVAVNLNTQIIYWNRFAEKLYGWTADEMLGRTINDLLTDDQRIKVKALRANIITGKGWTGEITLRRKDGTKFPAMLTASLVYDNNNEIVGLVGCATDITERKKQEEEQRESQELYRTLARNFPNGAVFLFDKDLRYLITEGSSLLMHGFSRETLEGKTIWEVLPPGRATSLAKLYQTALAGTSVTEETDWNGRTYYNYILPVKNEQGEIFAGMIVSQDITERKQVEAQIQEMNFVLEDRVAERTAELEQNKWELEKEIVERRRLEQELRVALDKEKELSQLKSRFISMTSHEFRTPLSTILTSSELLEHYQWSEEKRAIHFQRIATSVDHMTNMLDDVLIIGKAETGKLEFKPTHFDIIEFCRELVEEVHLGLARNRIFDFNSSCETLQAYADDKLLRQILSNLLSNAIKYSNECSRVKIALECNDDTITFTIADEGIGIPAVDLPHLFEVFYRASNVNNYAGTGLGLAIVKKCLDLHQGTIEVKSEVGLGTTFIITLPLQTKE